MYWSNANMFKRPQVTPILTFSRVVRILAKFGFISPAFHFISSPEVSEVDQTSISHCLFYFDSFGVIFGSETRDAS